MENTNIGLVIAVVALIFAGAMTFRAIKQARKMLKNSKRLVEDLKNRSSK